MLGGLFSIMALYSTFLSVYSNALLKHNNVLLAYYIPFDCVLIFLMGPFVFLYVKCVLKKRLLPQSWLGWLQVLPLFPSVFYVFYFMSLPTNQRIGLLIHNIDNGSWMIDVLNSLFYVQMTVYLFISYRLIKRYIGDSSVIYKNLNSINISWLKTLLKIDLIIMFVSVIPCFYFSNERTSNIIAQLTMDIQLIYIFAKTTWQTGVFPSELKSELKTDEKSKESVLKISDDLVEEYLKKLLVFMEEKKPYLNEDCTIQCISEQIGISVHHLSNILNQRFDTNFPDFINQYRINEAQKIINSSLSDKMTLEAIGYECGFGSKSSFNKAFKKLTNLTPSEYRACRKS